jgi:hypothetical protein
MNNKACRVCREKFIRDRALRADESMEIELDKAMLGSAHGFS